MPQSDSFEMRGLGDFKVVQEPGVDGRGGKDAKNITDRGGGVVRFLLRVGPGGAWWDGDGSGAGRGATRQRAECRQLGGDLAQKRGETWEYGATLRTDPDFKVWGGGWNALMQVKPSGPDPGGQSHHFRLKRDLLDCDGCASCLEGCLCLVYSVLGALFDEDSRSCIYKILRFLQAEA